MSIAIRFPGWPRAAALSAVLLGGCRQAGTVDGSKSPTAMLSSCASDSLHPVAAPPAAGIWVGERAVPATRVAAMVGPASPDENHARITRRVESVELRDGAAPIRSATDTASMKLELLPAFGGRARATDAPGKDTEPVAVYAITPLVLLASYEPCDASAGEPRIRYLRRDERGAVAMDLMLRRESIDATAAVR